MIKRKKLCKNSHCGVKTLHTVVTNDNDVRVWECSNCYHQSKIVVRAKLDEKRASKYHLWLAESLKKAQDDLFEELSK